MNYTSWRKKHCYLFVTISVVLILLTFIVVFYYGVDNWLNGLTVLALLALGFAGWCIGHIGTETTEKLMVLHFFYWLFVAGIVWVCIRFNWVGFL